MSELTPLIHSHLTAQLGHDPAVEALASWISDQALDWTPPGVAPAEIDLIVAYAFGNRPQADDPAAESWGGMVGGPVNGALADAVAELHARRPVRIYAQWEIADDLVRRHGLSDVVSIRPVTGPDGRLIYLSTDGVARDIIQREDRLLGRVAIIAHRDHVWRCVEVSRAAGLDAGIAEGLDLPGAYDPRSGQDWTRSREAYLLHDLMARLMGRRAEALARVQTTVT